MKTRLEFEKWPTDLLIDYALKIHHRGIREEGPETLARLNALAAKYNELIEVAHQFGESLNDLDEHLMKEENILFPFIYEIMEASQEHRTQQGFHCGSVQNPIAVMMSDHEGETARHEHIAYLTHQYTAPEGVESEYQAVLDRLKDFKEALEEHILIEDKIIFPRQLPQKREIYKDKFSSYD